MSDQAVLSASRAGLAQERAPFRKDIQGIRAVAVLLVVAYHGGFAWLSGGYVGVDVFFVISGFLITNHLLASASRHGRITFTEFYARRIRRILPASFVVVALTGIAALVYLPPTMRPLAMRDAMWTAVYMPNIAFARRETDYLAETAPSPFQHYWSLGVEEQFYLVWPALVAVILFVARAQRRRIVALTATIVVTSFLYGWWLTYASQPWAFFGLPSRAWELGVGALIAIAGPAVISRLPGIIRTVGAWTGLALIVVSAVSFDATTAFPGTAALVPVLGTGLLVALGQVPSRGGPLVVLSRPSLQFMGEISYSVYLVHWPLLVIPAMANGRELSAVHTLLLAALSVPLAWILYRVVERPFKAMRVSGRRARWIITAALATSALIVALAYVGWRHSSDVTLDAGRPIDVVPPTSAPSEDGPTPPVFTEYVPTNMRPSLEDAAASVPTIYATECHLSWQDTGVQDCAFGDVHSPVRVALFGDSHAAQWFPALEAVALDAGFRLEVYTKSSCPSVKVPIYVNGVPYGECETWREAVIAHLAADPPDVVVLSNMANQPDQPDPEALSAVWANGIADVIGRLNGPVLVITDTPNMGINPGFCLSANLTSAMKCAVDRPDAIDSVWQASETLAAIRAGATVVDLNDHICNAEQCGPIVADMLVYRDAHHLTVEFVKSLAPLVGDAVQKELDRSRSLAQ